MDSPAPGRARIGPYVVVGYLHAPPTIDPLRTTDRRPIVALTGSTVEYSEGGAIIRIESDTVLVNSSKIDRLEAASSDDLGPARHVDRGTAADPRARDLSGNF